MKTKLIALDLDGTLLKNGNEVSEANRQAIVNAHNNGIKVVISTGRVYGEVPESVRNIKEISNYITSNGATVLDEKGNVIISNSMPRDFSDKVIKVIKKYNCLLDIYTAGKAYIRKFDVSELPSYGLTEDAFEVFKIYRNFVDDIYEFYDKECGLVEKFGMYFGKDDERADAIMELGKIIPPPQLTYSMELNLEITSAGCTKGKALSELAKKYGFFPYHVMAIGDSDNDISMLDYAEKSVAMGNAPQFVKEYAKYETETCENDGVAAAIEKYAYI